MRLGIVIGHHGETVRNAQAYAQLAERAGLDFVGVADTIGAELFAQLAACALVTSRIGLGSCVTNPMTRYPAVLAQGFSTIDELSGGRAFVGLGSGRSAVVRAGAPPATIANLRDAIETIRAGTPRPVPVILHARAPRSLDLAGDRADGAMLQFGGAPSEELGDQIRRLRQAHAAGPRAHAPFEIWLYAPTFICDDEQEGIAAMSSLVAARASGLKEESVPAELRPSFAEYVRRYDFASHASATVTTNNDVLRELGLDAYMTDRLAFVGSATTVAERLDRYSSIGIDAVAMTGAVSDKRALIARLEELVAVRRT